MSKLPAVIIGLSLSISSCTTGNQMPYPPLDGYNPTILADRSLNTEESRSAYGQFLKTAKDFPKDATPWVGIARLFFTQENYALAIIYGTEALKRDSSHGLATSIVAVSGLRIASAALIDLKRMNHLNLSTKSDAEALVTLLRTEIGEERLVPPPASSKRP